MRLHTWRVVIRQERNLRPACETLLPEDLRVVDANNLETEHEQRTKRLDTLSGATNDRRVARCLAVAWTFVTGARGAAETCGARAPRRRGPGKILVTVQTFVTVDPPRCFIDHALDESVERIVEWRIDLRKRRGVHASKY